MRECLGCFPLFTWLEKKKHHSNGLRANSWQPRTEVNARSATNRKTIKFKYF